MSLDVDDSEVKVDIRESLGLTKLDDDDKEMNPSDALTIAGALGAIAGRSKFADVYFLVGQGKELKKIPGHRVILAASSDIFEHMLYPTTWPDDKDKTEEYKTDTEIEIPDVKPSVFKTMLASIYGDKAEIKASELTDLITCAKKFQVEGLRQLCASFMEEGVTVDNCCELFENASKALGEATFGLAFIEDNAAEVLASSGFDGLSKERIQTILKSDKLSIDELDVFKAVLRWTLAELKRTSKQETSENKKALLKDVLPLVRFPHMTMEEVATQVAPLGLLEASQLLEIYTWIGKPERSKPKISFDATPRLGNADMKWVLDTSLKSSYITLSNKNRAARSSSSSYAVTMGTNPWSKGIHSWRITRTEGQSQWLLLGVSKKAYSSDSSYTSSDFWGMSGSNQLYKAGSNTSCTSNFATGPIDAQLDSDKGTLTLVNLATSTRMVIDGIPQKTALVPHFCLYSYQAIEVAPLKNKDFGKKSS